MTDAKPYSVWEVRSEWIMGDEPMGSKNKFWVELPGDEQPWLFKYSRVNDSVPTGEHWAEKVAAEIAYQLQLPHARVELAVFDGSFGSLSRSFDALAQDGVELVHGNDLLAGLLHNYDPERVRGQQQHTLDNILTAVGNATADDPRKQTGAFMMMGGYIVLDALILNTDRHHENWALLRHTVPEGRSYHEMAPTFDHASSLGREHDDAKLGHWLQKEPWRVEWYADRGSGGIFLKPEGRHGANPIKLVETARRLWPSYVWPWIERLRALGSERVLAPIDLVPEDCIGDHSRAFARRLLSYTYHRLTSR